MAVSISKEDYLKTIAEAESEGEAVVASTLAAWLSVSLPAASMAIKRLKRDGYVDVDRRGAITLSGEGRKIASRILRRHHLLERMLAQVFHYEWYKIHEEAERLEHAISDDFERKLIALLGEDGPCPHGNRLGEDTPGTRRRRSQFPLSEALPGQSVQVMSVFERDRPFLEFLDGLQVRPGSVIQVQSKAWDETLTCEVNGATTVIGARALNLIWVTLA
ncbi:MAG: metal-dependent transcriptional regulator [Acidobacteria bacterium]|nr:metal-dependent transcriptional regulator [Acidobacteriota bacterium]